MKIILECEGVLCSFVTVRKLSEGKVEHKVESQFFFFFFNYLSILPYFTNTYTEIDLIKSIHTERYRHKHRKRFYKRHTQRRRFVFLLPNRDNTCFRLFKKKKRTK